MQVNIDNIYRVVYKYKDSAGFLEKAPQTTWTKNKSACEKFIDEQLVLNPNEEKGDYEIQVALLCDEGPLGLTASKY